MSEDDEGGSPVCFLPNVCPACGRLTDTEPRPDTCPECGADLPDVY